MHKGAVQTSHVLAVSVTSAAKSCIFANTLGENNKMNVTSFSKNAGFFPANFPHPWQEEGVFLEGGSSADSRKFSY